MSLQNRVTPFGNITADSSRGLYTGNRGILHIAETRQLHPTRRWSSKAWIYCVCDYKGHKREVFGRNGPNGSPGWTNLFFQDEATALAAGHRPCFYCQRKRANEFQRAFSQSNKLPMQKAPQIDMRLHQQRLNGKDKKLHAIKGDWRDLPNGAMVARGEVAYLVLDKNLFEWSFSGYRKSSSGGGEYSLVTPPASVAAMANGFEAIQICAVR